MTQNAPLKIEKMGIDWPNFENWANFDKNFITSTLHNNLTVSKLHSETNQKKTNFNLSAEDFLKKFSSPELYFIENNSIKIADLPVPQILSDILELEETTLSIYKNFSRKV